MIEKGQDVIKHNRMYWADNLRTFMVFLVILLHASIVYEKTGFSGPWWIVSEPLNSDLPGILFIILNAFVMVTIFFISGIFTPLSLKSKSAWEFLKSKFKRLILPWIVAALTLLPAYKIIFLFSRNLPQENWTTYFHWTNGTYGQNWLWFLPVLFVFDVLYLCFSRVQINIFKISLERAIGTIFLVSFLNCFFMDFFGFQGWTITALLDFERQRVGIYFMVFLLGSLCQKLKIFETGWKNRKFDIILHCSGWIPISLYIFILVETLLRPGRYFVSEFVDTLVLQLCFVLSVAYLLYTMITIFKNYLNRQGKISRMLNENSYHVYIIHVIVMGGIALSMLNTAIPPQLKLFILTGSTFAGSNLIIHSYKRILESR